MERRGLLKGWRAPSGAAGDDGRAGSPHTCGRDDIAEWYGEASYFFEAMPKAKVALTLDAELLGHLDTLVSERRFRNRSQAIESALAEKLGRLARTRLATECAKLDPAVEQRLADEGLAGESWPEY